MTHRLLLLILHDLRQVYICHKVQQQVFYTSVLISMSSVNERTIFFFIVTIIISVIVTTVMDQCFFTPDSFI